MLLKHIIKDKREKMFKQKRSISVFCFVILVLTIIIHVIVLIPNISAQNCDVNTMKLTLRKGLANYYPSPEKSNFNKSELKDLVDFYRKSENLTSSEQPPPATGSR